MGEVSLQINGKSYPILCDDGQEQRVMELAKFVDGKLQEIAKSGAANNDNHLLALTALILADEVFELKNNLSAADQLMQEAGAGQENLSESDEQAIADAINSLANRITLVSDRIQKA